MSRQDHLSDLDLDRLRLARATDESDPARAHLASCGLCSARLAELDEAAQHARVELAAALTRAERAGERSPRRRWALPALATAAAGVAALVAVALWPNAPDRPADSVVIKGGPSLRVLVGGAEASDELQVGQELTVRLAGRPAPRRLILRDVDGSLETLWPRGADDREAGLEGVVEINLTVGEPPGRLALIALHGPAPLSEARGRELAASLARRDGESALPRGFVGTVRSYRVIRARAP